MNASLRRIPGGQAGLRQKVRTIRKLVHDAKRDPAFRELAVGIVRHVPERDWAGEVGAVVNFVRSRMRYTRDPYDPQGLELFVDPKLSLQQALSGGSAGDCDDHVLLASALLETIGHPTRYRVGGQARHRYGHIWLDVLDDQRGWVPVELTKKTEPVGWDPSGLFPHVETYNGGGMNLQNYAYDLEGLDGIGKYLKKAKQYLGPMLSFLGPLAYAIPGVGPFLAPLITAGGMFASGGGGFGGGGVLPSNVQSYGSLFSQAWNALPGMGPTPGGGMIGPQQMERGPTPRFAVEYGGGGVDPFDYVQGKVQSYASKFGFRNPFRFLEGLDGLGWIPPELGLSKYQGSTDPKTDHVAMTKWHRELQAKMFAEMGRVGHKDHRWRLTKNKDTGILEKYPPRPGFSEGGIEAAKKDWGPGIVGIPSFTFWIWTQWILDKHPIPPPEPNSTYDWGARVAFINNYTRQVHQALWQLGLAERQEKEKTAAAKAAAKIAEEEAKKERARLAKAAEEERKLEEEQLRKELEHRRRQEELKSQGRYDQARREAEARRAEEMVRTRSGIPQPPIRLPGGGPPPDAPGKKAGGISIGTVALIGAALLMTGKRR